MEIEEAREKLQERIRPIRDSLMVQAEEAGGLVTGCDIKASHPIPPFNRASEDGYAVYSGDVKGASREDPVRIRIVGEILAGEDRSIPYEKNTAIRVTNGAMMPDCYDAVVSLEDAEKDGDTVLIKKAVQAGENYSPAGEEAQAGKLLIPEGRRIGRVEAGLIAGLGLREVRVRRKATVAIISTGSELIRSGMILKKGRIHDSIASMLSFTVTRCRLSVSMNEICRDREKDLCRLIRKAVRSTDLVVTTGGISGGKKDLIPAALEMLGAENIFRDVNIYPGSRTMGNLLEGTVILSLPGDPYSAIANFDMYFGWCAAKLMGCDSYIPSVEEAVLADPYENENGFRRLVRAKKEGTKLYLPVSTHKSSVFGNLTECNCYMDLPAMAKVSVGDTVKIVRIGD